MGLKIIIFDPYTIALQGMTDVLQPVEGFEIIGSFTKGSDLLSCVKANSADMVILNLMLKSSEGLELIEKIKKMRKRLKIMMFTDANDRLICRRALEIGANALLSEDTTGSELVHSIITVAKGNDILPSFLVEEKRNAILSEMEVGILNMILNEYTNDEIAKELFISKRTVENYITNIYHKLGVEGRISAVREAIRLKIV
jgi:two-component system vancomycin resistance associated response regulator VraR